MMKELSMHIIDIAQNSIKAEAKIIEITVLEDESANVFSFSIKDDGCGMSSETLAKVRDPFTTSRTTRKVGLGIPMLEQTCIQCGGGLILESELGKGTFIEAKMEYNNIDRPPMGDIINSLHILFITNPDFDFIYRHTKNGKEFFIGTAEIKEVLDGVPFSEPEVMAWLKENIESGINELG